MTPKVIDSFSLAQERFEKAEERTIRDAGFGSTKAALSIIEKHISKATHVIEEKLKVTSRSSVKDIVEDLKTLKPELLALVAMQGAMDCIGNEEDLTKTFHKLGAMAEKEVYAQSLLNHDKKLSGRLEERAKRRGGSVKYRRAAVSKMAKDQQFTMGKWSKEAKGRAGMWLVEVLTEIDEVFVIVRSDEHKHSFITLTAEALEYSQALVARLIEDRPVALPLVGDKAPEWKSFFLPMESNGRSYEVPMIRKATKVQKAYVLRAITEGRMDAVLRALTKAGSTVWAINPRILEIVRQAYALGVEIDGMPLKSDLELPAKMDEAVWEAMTEEEKRDRRGEIAEKLSKNRSLIGERSIYEQDLATADYLIDHGNRFVVPMNMDYRGRVYSVSYFSYQRQDYVRGMFQYANGKPLGPTGLYWLMIHLANCGDFEKVSKKTFDDRVAWVQTHSDRFVSMAQDPIADMWWAEADAPFCFLAAAMAYAEALKDPQGYVCHIPLGFDGTCSGLQHLAAMTRCDSTAPLVNLTPNALPADVYRTVAEHLRDKVQAIAALEGENSHVFRKALAFGIDRSLVKRNVMTYTYGSKKFGMIQQLMDDAMRPLQTKVIRKRIPEHPFQVPEDTYEAEDGRVVTNPGRTAAKILGPMIFDTIEEVVKRPAEAMRFLQKVSKAMSHEGKPTVWHTPLGLPVVLHYPNIRTEQVFLWMHDRGVRVKARMATSEEQPGIDKAATANAVAPCFVHSYDACHLQMVALEAEAQGIDDLALVHDSFGCHACDAGRFRRVVTDTFFDLYDQHDVLDEFLMEAHAQIHTNHHRLPIRSDVSTGSYDLSDVKESLYAFA